VQGILKVVLLLCYVQVSLSYQKCRIA
jgi:hypothetical protein